MTNRIGKCFGDAPKDASMLGAERIAEAMIDAANAEQVKLVLEGKIIDQDDSAQMILQGLSLVAASSFLAIADKKTIPTPEEKEEWLREGVSILKDSIMRLIKAMMKQKSA